MLRRRFIATYLGLAALPLLAGKVAGDDAAKPEPGEIGKIVKTDAQWRELLTPERYAVLRHEYTEPAFSSSTVTTGP